MAKQIEIVARINNLGHMYCRECDTSGRGDPVHMDSSPHAFEKCDGCGVVVNVKAGYLRGRYVMSLRLGWG